MIFASALQTGSFPIHHLMQTKQSNITSAGKSNSTIANRQSRPLPAPVWLQSATKPQSLLQEEQHDFSGAAPAAQYSTAAAPKGSQRRLKHQHATTAAVSPAAWLEAQLVAPSKKRTREEEVTGVLQRAHQPDVASDSKQTIEQTEHQRSLETGRSTHRQSGSGLPPLEAPEEDDLMWNFVVDTVLDNRCLPDSVSRELDFSHWQRPLMGILYVKAGFPTMSSEKKLNYYPDCVNAFFKDSSSAGVRHRLVGTGCNATT
ncbi:uncharacterized protein [Physeter macrocephalus]|uniref:Uncharacterized protein n=1 Tax=Physeter macrocephalus TaxID=9755 RepID=A0A455ARR8_PHYMC|nr:uncharacterized protein LOC114485744 [Physeter catodon]|eukprot:XP_028334561.1 uncharacterized protein LOC114484187 [Physeter catodon]